MGRIIGPRNQRLGGLLEEKIARLPKEVRDIPDELLLEHSSGHENYERALGCLIARFAGSSYCKPDLITGKAAKRPDQLVFESVHLLITKYFGNEKLFPLSPEGRPLGVPEIALIMGALIGTAAAQAYEDKQVTLDEVEAQIELAWIAMRDWLPRGILTIREARERGDIKKVPQ
jgi:hypothetical protein